MTRVEQMRLQAALEALPGAPPSAPASHALALGPPLTARVRLLAEEAQTTASKATE